MRRFSRPVSAGSTAAYWPGQPDRAAHALRVRGDVDAGDAQRARVGPHQRRDRPDERRLAGAVGAEHREHAPGGRARSSPASASTSPKCLVRPSASTIVLHSIGILNHLMACVNHLYD